jgi:hypothetical protein
MSRAIDPAHARLFVRLAESYWSGAEIERDDLARWLTDAGVVYDVAIKEPCSETCFCAANYELPTICSALSFDVLSASWRRA